MPMTPSWMTKYQTQKISRLTGMKIKIFGYILYALWYLSKQRQD